MLEKLAVLIVALVALSGCATTAINSAKAIPVPPEQIYISERLPEEGNAVVVFVRDVGSFASANFMHIYLDGDRVASLDPGQKFELVVRPGEHALGVKMTDPFNLNVINGVDLYAKQGQRYMYRIQSSQAQGGPSLRRLLKEEAE